MNTNAKQIDYCIELAHYNHGMLNGIFTSRGFAPDSNDEAGLGRLDLRIKDRRNRSILLMEFKRSKQESDLDADCDDAIAQIFDHGYDRTLPEGYERRIIYGIAFYQLCKGRQSQAYKMTQISIPEPGMNKGNEQGDRHKRTVPTDFSPLCRLGRLASAGHA